MTTATLQLTQPAPAGLRLRAGAASRGLQLRGAPAILRLQVGAAPLATLTLGSVLTPISPAGPGFSSGFSSGFRK